MDCCGDAPVLGEIINGALDGVAFAQRFDMADEQRSIHRIGMVKILLGALVKRQMRKVFVIVVLLKQQDAFFGKDRRSDDW